MTMSQSMDTSDSRRPESAEELIDQQWLDSVLDRVDEQGLQLTGEGGFLPATGIGCQQYKDCIAMTKEESHNAGYDWDKQSAEHFCTKLYGH